MVGKRAPGKTQRNRSAQRTAMTQRVTGTPKTDASRKKERNKARATVTKAARTKTTTVTKRK